MRPVSTEPNTEEEARVDEAAQAQAAEAQAAEGAEGEESEPQFIEAFGKEAIISIALFIGFIAFVIVCLPTYIF